MDTLYIVLLTWASLLVIFYFGVWFEYTYYRHNLPKKFKSLVDAFTEEEEEE